MKYFRYGLEQERSDVQSNCYLSDWSSQDINPTHMPDMDGAELYERGSFGRGCEPYAVPFFNMERFNGKQGDEGKAYRSNARTFFFIIVQLNIIAIKYLFLLINLFAVCYSGYSKPCKLTPYAVLLATFVNSEQDCRQKCSRMRETDSIPCMSYSYK